jgi:predicted ABC-type ATPase
MNDRFLYIIAGCNGAGKTTASFAILPEILECKEFVNADEIAKGISPFKPESVSLEAGRIMLNRIKELLNYQNSFAFETTLATKSYKNTIIEAKEKGYTVVLLYFWLQSIDLAKERVKTRFSEGGHNIESEVIERRYKAGIVNLFDIYLDIADYSLLFDNSEGKYELIAEKSINEDIRIINVEKFNQLKFFV